MGHSMGAKTVLFFEYKFPGIARQLIIVDMAAREYPAHHAKVLEALHNVNFDKIGTRKEAEAVLGEHITDFGTKQFLLKNIYWKEDADKKMGWRFNLKVITENYDQIRAAVPDFRSETPAIIIKGENSDYLSEDDIVDYKNRFQNCDFVSIAGAGHWVHAEKPKEFFEATLQHLHH
jgi:pimeloyl-ACP methyl ester carboxylesterase